MTSNAVGSAAKLSVANSMTRFCVYLQGSKSRDKKRARIAENKYKVGEPVYEVDAFIPQEDELGMVPPPSSLAAPWAARPEPVAKKEAVRPELIVEKTTAQIQHDWALQPAPATEQGQSSASSPSVVASQTAKPQIARLQTARPQTARPQTARPVIEPIAER